MTDHPLASWFAHNALCRVLTLPDAECDCGLGAALAGLCDVVLEQCMVHTSGDCERHERFVYDVGHVPGKFPKASD